MGINTVGKVMGVAFTALLLTACSGLSDGPESSSGQSGQAVSAKCAALSETNSAPGPNASAATGAQVQDAVKAAECLTALPDTILTSLAKPDEAKGQHPFVECDKSKDALQCEYGDPNGTKLMVVYGDSRGDMWAGALEPIAAQHGWKLRVFSAGGCPVPDLDFISTETKTPNDACNKSHEGIPGIIKNLHPDLILATSLNYTPLVDGSTPTQEQWKQGWEATLGQLTQPGTKLVLIGSTPWWDNGDARCLAAHSDDVQKCGSPVGSAHTDNSGERAAATTAGALYVDTVPWICADMCEPVIAGTRVYGDGHHLTQSYVTYVSGALDESLQPALAG